MAQCAASPSCVRLILRSNCVKKRVSASETSHFRISRRKYSRGSFKVVNPFTWKTCRAGFSSLGESSCLGSLVDLDGAAVPDWLFFSDQLLLMTSMFLTYMAGVIPLQKQGLAPRKTVLDENAVVSTSSGSTKKKDDCGKSDYAWVAVKEKLLDSLDAIEHGSDVEGRKLGAEQQQVSRPLSLYAVSERPKLRLLWASLRWLEEEVNNIFGDYLTVNMDDWFTKFRDIIQKICHPVCIAWLAEDLCLENHKSEEAFVSLMVEKLNGDDIILQTIRTSGKEDLYAELLYFLRFGTLRKGCCYDHKLFITHGVSILEDLVVTLADGIANVYLELISVDGNLSNEVNISDLFTCNLSTRALQRLRNEVALKQWLYQNVEAVVSMYEDRFDLCTLQLKFIETPSRNQTENRSWWKKFIHRNSERTMSSSSYVAITQFSMPVKRTKELRALTGWRYYFSLYLELSDISMPLIRAIMEKISNAISFFLVSLIGRSVGLIYTGIRQSLRWK